MTSAHDDTGRAPRPRPVLSRERIVATALAMIDRDGLEKTSMRRLGAELGADPMAVYHYFPNKAALLDGVVEAVYRTMVVPSDDDRSWQEYARAFADAMRATLLRHPRALPAIATRPVTSPVVLAMIESLASRLMRAGADASTSLDVVNCVAMFTIGHALAEAGEPVGGDSGAAVDVPALVALLPTLAAALADGYEFDFDRQYQLGLDLLIDGLGRRIG